jgi:SAM-dependent methyltransferase
MGADIPSREDLQSPEGAAAWVAAADRKRPWRAEFRQHIADRLEGRRRILELGSGPGLLAECVLRTCVDVERLVLLDFSVPMLEMCRGRLGEDPRVQLIEDDFRSPGWVDAAPGPFDAVISMQAVHELRHKCRASQLYEQVHHKLVPNGLFLVCDHVPRDASPFQTGLYMTEAEQHRALAGAGFRRVETVRSRAGLLIYCSTRGGLTTQ